MPNGKVLLIASPAGEGGSYPGPTHFFEFDPNANTMTAVPDPPNAGGPCFTGRMMLLPTGQVLFTSGSTEAHVYTPSPSAVADDDHEPSSAQYLRDIFVVCGCRRPHAKCGGHSRKDREGCNGSSRQSRHCRTPLL